MNKHIKAKYIDEDCEVTFGRYASGEIAIQLLCPITGEPWAKVTASCVPYGLPEVDYNKEIYLKDYAENQGMRAAMHDAGLIEAVVSHVAFGRVTMCKCTLTQEAITELQRQTKK